MIVSLRDKRTREFAEGKPVKGGMWLRYWGFTFSCSQTLMSD